MKKIINKNTVFFLVVTLCLGSMILFLCKADDALKQTKLPKYSAAASQVIDSVDFDKGTAYEV